MTIELVNELRLLSRMRPKIQFEPKNSFLSSPRIAFGSWQLCARSSYGSISSVGPLWGVWGVWQGSKIVISFSFVPEKLIIYILKITWWARAGWNSLVPPGATIKGSKFFHHSGAIMGSLAIEIVDLNFEMQSEYSALTFPDEKNSRAGRWEFLKYI